MLRFGCAGPGPGSPRGWRCGCVVGRDAVLTDDGELRHDLSLDPSGFHMATGVREQHGTVWLGTLRESAVAAFDLP